MIQLCYHANCFDGVVSAAIFTRFLRTTNTRTEAITYRGMFHGARDPYAPDHDAFFAGDLNAVLDFRYSPSARLHWWCDHHITSFLRPEDQQHFEHTPRPTHRFDPTAPSCAGLLARWLSETHGFAGGEVADHVAWADIIDSARFRDAAQAVELAEPALQLMALLESGPSDELCATLINGLATQSIADVHQLPTVARALAPVLDAHRRTVAIVGTRLQVKDGVAFVDLVDASVEAFNKFAPYYFDPSVRYTVVLTHSQRRAKVSVGSNPFCRPDPMHNIAKLCERYGGGGHPVVGAASFPPQQLDLAARAAREIASVLAGDPST